MPNNMTIDEVDELLKLGEPSSSIPAYIAWFATLLVYGFGIIGLINVINGKAILLAALITGLAALISQTYLILIIYGALVFTVTVIGSILLLYLVRKAAKFVLYLVFIIIPIVMIGLGLLLLPYSSLGGLISIGMGAFYLLLLVFYRKRIALAGRAMQLSAQAILDEKGSILAMFISSIFGMLTFVFLIFASSYVGDLVYYATNNQDYGALAGFIIFFLGSWSVSFVAYLMEGTIAGIVHDWYRSPNVDVASFGKGLKRALKVQGGIALYALLMVTLRFIVEYLKSQARKSGSIGAEVAAAVIDLLRGIIQFITIYTIPALVIRQTNFKAAVKDSWSKLKDLFIETLAGTFGFGYVMFFFTLIMIIFYGAIGYFIGVYVLHPIITSMYITSLDTMSVGIVSGVSFVVIGIIPTALIFNTLNITFKTILYEFGLDIEFSRKGITLPKRLPSDIEEEFMEILATKGIRL